MNISTKKIVILGSGIGGLAVAHELSQFKNKYNIHIFERNSLIGGMARSFFTNRNGVKLPTEYCWRIYGPGYDNLREILKQIPLKNNPSKSVHENLVDISNYLIADKNRIFTMNNRPQTLLTNLRRAFKDVPFNQKVSVISKILYCFMISTDRLNTMDSVTWQDYINPQDSLHPDMKKYIVDIMAPYLGAEATRVNVPSVAKTLESFKIFNRPISVMNGPTNEAWFQHWQAHLETNGVTFHLNSEVVDAKLNADEDKVESILLKDGSCVTADIFFCCLPVESVAKIKPLKIRGISELASRSRQLMVGIQLYFDKKIPLPHQNTAMYIPDSPWQLVIEPQGLIWSKTYGDVEDIWSVGLCDPIRAGILIHKSFIECSPEEIKNEVWSQIISSEINKYVVPSEARILDYCLWDTYVFDGHKLDTYEPKFSTNQGTYDLRPHNKTKYINLYFATAYTKTETDMFEMEGAAESAKRAARYLEPSVKVAGNDRPLFFTLYRWLDAALPQLNLFSYSPIAFYFLGLPLAMAALPLLYWGRFLRFGKK